MSLLGERARRAAWALAVAIHGLVGAGCAGVTPRPFDGPVPGSILVRPAAATATGAERVTEEQRTALDAACGALLRDRGYAAIAGPAAFSKLDAAGARVHESEVLGELSPEVLSVLADVAGIDAVLEIQLEYWHAVPGPGAPLSVGVRAVVTSTRSARPIWVDVLSAEVARHESRTARDPFADPDPFESDDPFPYRRVTQVYDSQDVAGLIVRRLLARLPAR